MMCSGVAIRCLLFVVWYGIGFWGVRNLPFVFQLFMNYFVKWDESNKFCSFFSLLFLFACRSVYIHLCLKYQWTISQFFSIQMNEIAGDEVYSDSVENANFFSLWLIYPTFIVMYLRITYLYTVHRSSTRFIQRLFSFCKHRVLFRSGKIRNWYHANWILLHSYQLCHL